MKGVIFFEQKIDGKASLSKIDKWQRMTKFLILSILKRSPDIVFTILITSYFAKNLSPQYTKAIKKNFRNIKGLKQQDIIYDGQDKLFIKGYSNSNQVGDKKS